MGQGYMGTGNEDRMTGINGTLTENKSLQAVIRFPDPAVGRVKVNSHTSFMRRHSSEQLSQSQS